MENTVSLLVPHQPSPVTWSELSVFTASDTSLLFFDERAVSLLDAFGRRVLSDRSLNAMPEMAALGFWLRKSSLLQMKAENQHLVVPATGKTAPLGTLLHICPANVDTIFMYSLAIALLCGNRNIVRISSRMDADPVLKLFAHLDALLQEKSYLPLQQYINLIRYPHSDSISNGLSAAVQGRVLWGGDQTIATFRRFSTSPRCRDIAFADRVSVCVIDGNHYTSLDEAERRKLLHAFLNDAYTFDQLGCSSPQTLFFLADSVETGNAIAAQFADDFSAYLAEARSMDTASLAGLKFNRAVDDALSGTITGTVGNAAFTLAPLADAAQPAQLHSCGGGYFYSRVITSLQQLSVLKNARVQTVTYSGLTIAQVDEIAVLAAHGGIDRVVPVGRGLQFHYLWDGWNLFEAFSRRIGL
jgi:hypothetical protein